MVKRPPKMTALVVSAIRNLREVKGSTPREILNYIVSEYNASNPTSDSAMERKLCTALKRGLEYGILKQVHGHYSLNSDPETTSPMEDMLGPMDRGSCGCKSAMLRKRRRRASRKGGGCKSGGGRVKRARKRGGGGGASGARKRLKSRKARSKGGRCKSKSKSRARRARRAKSKKSCGKKRRSVKRSSGKSCRPKPKQCGNRRGGEDNMLVKDPIDASRHRENIIGGGNYMYERDERRSQSRGRQSVASRSRSPSHSRSSGSSDREGNDETRRDRQAE